MDPDSNEVLEKLSAALPLAESSPACPAEVLEALKASKDFLTGSMSGGVRRQHAGSIRWTFEDDAYEPNGREIELLLHYDWEDYSPSDGVTPSAGGCAQITDLEVLAVRYFDEHGDVIDMDQHHLDTAWAVVERNRELLEEKCTDAGHRAVVGRTSPIRFFDSDPAEGSSEGQETSDWRMAPSARKRGGKQGIRKQG